MVKLRTSTGVVCRLTICLLLLAPASASAATFYAEPGDLPDSIFSPLNLGAVSAGVNTVSGGVDAVWFQEFPSGEWFGDTQDAFAYEVPVGLVVTNIEMVVTNFNTTVSSVFGQGVSTTSGVDTPFFPFNTTIPNLLTDGEPLADGAYNYGLQIAPTCPGCFSGSLSYDWTVNITAVIDDELLYAEPADLSDELNTPTDLGALNPGLNKVRGGVSGSWVPDGQFGGDWIGDVTDTFEYSVPVGMMVTNFELNITNFSTDVASVFGETSSMTGGVIEGLFFGNDIVFPNALSDGPLFEGDHDFALNIADTCPACGSGNLSYDWEVILTLAICGDLDGDGFVGINDLNVVLGNWNQNVTVGSLLDGDINGDGFVGIDDLGKVLGNWNAGTPPTAQTSIPEPATAGVVVMGTVVFVGRRIRGG